jgi:hypothetical protein
MNIILPFLIDDDIKQQIISFALKDGLNFFLNNSHKNENNRRFCNLNKTNNILKNILQSYSDSLFKKLGMIDAKPEPMFGNFIGVNLENGFVHEHKDSRANNGFYHVRINFLVQKPISGGMPVIEKQIYLVEENQSWLNLASEWVHSSTPVVGDKERIVLSLGKYVNPKDINILS